MAEEVRNKVEAAVEILDRLVDALSRPLGDEDRRGGWTEESQLRWRDHFVQLRTRLLAGEGPSGEQRQLMRWLNFDGIGIGPLADLARTLQSQLRQAFADDVRSPGGTTGREAKRLLHELAAGRRRRWFGR